MVAFPQPALVLPLGLRMMWASFLYLFALAFWDRVSLCSLHSLELGLTYTRRDSFLCLWSAGIRVVLSTLPHPVVWGRLICVSVKTKQNKENTKNKHKQKQQGLKALERGRQDYPRVGSQSGLHSKTSVSQKDETKWRKDQHSTSFIMKTNKIR